MKHEEEHSQLRQNDYHFVFRINKPQHHWSNHDSSHQLAKDNRKLERPKNLSEPPDDDHQCQERLEISHRFWLCCTARSGARDFLARAASGGAIAVRHSQAGDPIEYGAANFDLNALTFQVPRP